MTKTEHLYKTANSISFSYNLTFKRTLANPKWKKMFNINIKYLWRLLSDLVIITILLAFALNVSKLWGRITRRGFFCGDESLMYPIRRDTVQSSALYAIGLIIPLVVIVVCGLLENLVLSRRPLRNGLRAFITVHISMLPFIFGFAAERLLKQISKVSVGRLRPNFFDACVPVLRGNPICDDAKNFGVYILNYECKATAGNDGVAAYLDHEMRTSFPSGHTSLVFYSMTFVVYYLHRFSQSLRRYRANFGLFVLLLQFLCVLLAWFVGISRVLDYKHHWSDVFAGGLLGLSVGIAVSYHVHGQLKGGRAFLEAANLPKRTPTVELSESVVASTMTVASPMESTNTASANITKVKVLY